MRNKRFTGLDLICTAEKRTPMVLSTPPELAGYVDVKLSEKARLSV